MNKKTKGLVAGVAGGALLLGAGGTFALWQDHEEISGGTITAGDLSLEVSPMEWWDISDDLEDLGWDTTLVGTFPGSGRRLGTSAELAEFRTVPSDKLMGYSKIAITYEGDNLRIRLALDPENTVVAQNGFGPDEISVEAALYAVDGQPFVDGQGTQITLGDLNEVGSREMVLDRDALEALDAADNPGGEKDGVATALLRVEFTFHADLLDKWDEENTEIRYGAGATLDLSELPFNVLQDRQGPLN